MLSLYCQNFDKIPAVLGFVLTTHSLYNLQLPFIIEYYLDISTILFGPEIAKSKTMGRKIALNPFVILPE
jgi:hypothetical protein